MTPSPEITHRVTYLATRWREAEDICARQREYQQKLLDQIEEAFREFCPHSSAYWSYDDLNLDVRVSGGHARIEPYPTEEEQDAEI